MSDSATQREQSFNFYQHRDDESVVLAARRNEAGEYECYRYFTHGSIDHFDLAPELFEGLYVPGPVLPLDGANES